MPHLIQENQESIFQTSITKQMKKDKIPLKIKQSKKEKIRYKSDVVQSFHHLDSRIRKEHQTICIIKFDPKLTQTMGTHNPYPLKHPKDPTVAPQFRHPNENYQKKKYRKFGSSNSCILPSNQEEPKQLEFGTTPQSERRN